MSSPTMGAGDAPAGISIAGYGEPATGNQLSQGILPDQNGNPQDGILIDWSVGDISFNPAGNLSGMNSVLQQVQITCLTALGSSCIPSLGTNVLTQSTINGNNQSAIVSSVTVALQPLVKNNSISQLSVSVSVTANGAGLNVIVSFFNNSLGVTQNLTLNGQ